VHGSIQSGVRGSFVKKMGQSRISLRENTPHCLAFQSNKTSYIRVFGDYPMVLCPYRRGNRHVIIRDYGNLLSKLQKGLKRSGVSKGTDGYATKWASYRMHSDIPVMYARAACAAYHVWTCEHLSKASSAISSWEILQHVLIAASQIRTAAEVYCHSSAILPSFPPHSRS
jgi:hypothetical protein